MSGIEAGVVLQLWGEATGSPPPHPENPLHCNLDTPTALTETSHERGAELLMHYLCVVRMVIRK